MAIGWALPGTVGAEIAAAHRRFADVDFGDLDEVDRVLVTIFGLYAYLKRYGFDGYYWNTASNYAAFAPEALRAVGSYRLAGIMSRANAKFGSAGPPPQLRARVDHMVKNAPRQDYTCTDQWYDLDREVEDYEDKIYDLLRAFLRSSDRIR